MNKKLRVIHFNDVYRLTRPKVKEDKEDKNKFVLDMKVIDPEGKIRDNYTHIIQFYEEIKLIRGKWEKNPNEELESLLLFSGDLFSPSVESSVTRGGNMVHLMNEIIPDASVPGNHEFDFGRERFDTLVQFCKFPWVATNLHELSDKKIRRLHPYIVIERPGLNIGVIGLVSADSWRKTNTKVQDSLKRSKMLDACKKFVPKLRKPKSKCTRELCERGEDCKFDKDCERGEGCDLVFALTHALHTEDIALAKAVRAYPVEQAEWVDIDYGVDILFGGHDHEYFLGKGVKRGSGSELRNDGILPHETDDGVLIIKSAFDFFDLSELEVEVAEIYSATCRKKAVKSVNVSRHHFKHPIPDGEPVNVPTGPSAITRMLKYQLNDEVVEALAEPVATLVTDLNLDSNLMRGNETAIGNWIADGLFEWYRNHELRVKAPLPKGAKSNASGGANTGTPEVANTSEPGGANASAPEAANAGASGSTNAGSSEAANAGASGGANAGASEAVNAGASEAANAGASGGTNTSASEVTPSPLKGVGSSKEPNLPRPRTVFLMNGGAIRADGKLDHRKPVRARDIIQLLPFDSTLKLFKMKSSSLLEALRAMLETSGDFPAVSGMTVRYKYKLEGDKRKVGEVIVKLTNKSGDVLDTDTDSDIRVLTNEYVADHVKYFGNVEKTDLTSFEELPAYQILQYYLNDCRPVGLFAMLAVKEIAAKRPHDVLPESRERSMAFQRLVESVGLDDPKLPKIDIQELTEDKKRIVGEEEEEEEEEEV